MKIYQEADIFVLLSHREGFPIAFIETIDSGLPVMATNFGGIPDLIDNSVNGILVNFQVSFDLAKAMMSLIEKGKLRHFYSLEGRNKASVSHDDENYVDHLIQYYQEIHC